MTHIVIIEHICYIYFLIMKGLRNSISAYFVLAFKTNGRRLTRIRKNVNGSVTSLLNFYKIVQLNTVNICGQIKTCIIYIVYNFYYIV